MNDTTPSYTTRVARLPPRGGPDVLPAVALAGESGGFEVRALPALDTVWSLPAPGDDVRRTCLGRFGARAIGVRIGGDGEFGVWDIQTGERLVDRFSFDGHVPNALTLGTLAGACLRSQRSTAARRW